MIYFFKNLPSLGALAVPSSFGPRKSKMKTRIQCNINSKILMLVKFQWVSVQWKWRMINIVDFFFLYYIYHRDIDNNLFDFGGDKNTQWERNDLVTYNKQCFENKPKSLSHYKKCMYIFFSWNQFHDIVFLKMIFVIFKLKKDSFWW